MVLFLASSMSLSFVCLRENLLASWTVFGEQVKEKEEGKQKKEEAKKEKEKTKKEKPGKGEKEYWGN